MRSSSPFARAIVVFALAATATAQEIAGSFAPNPAVPGEPITFTGTDATGDGFQVATPCAWYRVRRGTQTGPEVPIVQVCPQVLILVGPHGSYSITWDQRDVNGHQVPPDRYWFEIRTYAAVTYEQRADWFCIEIQGNPDAPVLRQLAEAQVGAAVPLEIDAPAHAGAAYRTLASFTANRPFSALGLDFCLSPDALFRRSLLAPGTVFSNGVGTLDGAGRSSGLTVNVPDEPALAYLGFQLQAVVGSGAGRTLTNAVAVTITP